MNEAPGWLAIIRRAWRVLRVRWTTYPGDCADCGMPKEWGGPERWAPVCNACGDKREAWETQAEAAFIRTLSVSVNTRATTLDAQRRFPTRFFNHAHDAWEDVEQVFREM